MSKFFKFQKVLSGASERASIRVLTHPSRKTTAQRPKEPKDGDTGLPSNKEYSVIAALFDAVKDPNAIDDRKMLVSIPSSLENAVSPIDTAPFTTVGADSRTTFALPQGKAPVEAGTLHR